MRRNEIAELRRLDWAKQPAARNPSTPLGTVMVGYFKEVVRPRQTKLSGIAQCWMNLVPESLNDHCTLDGLNRGTLTVLVDSSVHLYELRQLLLAGLQQQLLIACRPGGVRKIVLRPGRPDDGKARITGRHEGT
jgi:Dna[CI] antecedent DciA-like protein